MQPRCLDCRAGWTAAGVIGVFGFFGPSRAIILHVAREFLFEAGKGHIDDVNIKTWEDVGFRFAFEEEFKRRFDAFIGCNFACSQLLIGGIAERNAMFGTAR